jgi:tetratricopeptide (TPR) repeat protein
MDDLKSANVDTLIDKSKILYKIKQYSDSLETIEKAILIDPDNLDALISKSKTLYELKRYSDSLETIEKAILIVVSTDLLPEAI